MSNAAAPENPVVLFCCAVWPEPESSAAGVRARFVIDSILRLRPTWRLIVHSGALPNAAMEKLRTEQGLECESIPANDPRFDAWVGGLKPDIVIFERFYTEEQFGWRVREQVPSAVTVLDTSDLHFLRGFRQEGLRVAAPADVLGQPAGEDITRSFHRELASILRCERVWVVSHFEAKLLEGLPDFPAGRVALSRWGVEPLQVAPPFSERRHFVTIGNFRHPPNRDSVVRLKRDIWPEIRRLAPGLELHVYGAYPASRDMEIHAPREGFFMKGPWAGEVRDLLSRYRVLLAPLRFGAGIKGKILDAWSAGTPVVASDIGAEGMTEGAFPGVALEAGAEAAEWAEKSLALHESESQFNGIASAARLVLAREFDPSCLAPQLLAELEGLRPPGARPGLPRHWLSELLHSEERHSARALSKFIEMKRRVIP